MTVKELKKLINKYEDDLEVSFAKLSNNYDDKYILYKPLEFIKDKNDLIIISNPSCRSFYEKDLESKTKTILCSNCGKEREIPIYYYVYPPYCEECKEKIKKKG